MNIEGNRALTTPRAEPNRSVSCIDRRAAVQAMPRGEAGVRGHAGVVSPRAIGTCVDFAVTESTSPIERAYRVRLRLKPAQERRLLRLFGAVTGKLRCGAILQVSDNWNQRKFRHTKDTRDDHGHRRTD